MRDLSAAKHSADCATVVRINLDALAVACAFYEAVRYERHPKKVVVGTDSANTVAIFSSLHVKPLYNPILRFAVDLMVAGNHILRVTHIPGEVNVVADHLSRKKLQDARDYCPGLSIVDFEPPRVEPPSCIAGGSRKMIGWLTGATVKVREPWPREKLRRELTVALGACIADSTRLSYDTALCSYVEFVDMHDLPFRPTAETLVFYAVYMSHYIEPRSVAKYLTGIVNHLEGFYPDIRAMRGSALVRNSLKGCLRLYSSPVKRKRALSVDDLNCMANFYKVSTLHDDILFLSMLYMGFYGLMRLGELTDPDVLELRDWRRHISILSVKVSEHHYKFLLPANKVDPYFEGNRVVIHREVQSPLALEFFNKYIKARRSKFMLRRELWLRKDGSVPTRSFFLTRLRRFCSKDIADQSLRAGGATELAQSGMDPHLIQATGRWNSDAWFRYIRKNPILIHAFARAWKHILFES